jgi:ankyrin repeat protein
VLDRVKGNAGGSDLLTDSFRVVEDASGKGGGILNQILNGDTPFHAAAEAGRLGSIPAELLTVRNLTIRNKSGETALHCAASKGNLGDIPYELLEACSELTLADGTNLEERRLSDGEFTSF